MSKNIQAALLAIRDEIKDNYKEVAETLAAVAETGDTDMDDTKQKLEHIEDLIEVRNKIAGWL